MKLGKRKPLKKVPVEVLLEKKPHGGQNIKDIDPELVYALAKIHCTQREIAAVCGCSITTIKDRYIDIVHRGEDEGKSSLRRLQWEQAEKGNVQMLIWLGKQILGQKDKQPDEATQVHYNVFCNEVPK